MFIPRLQTSCIWIFQGFRGVWGTMVRNVPKKQPALRFKYPKWYMSINYLVKIFIEITTSKSSSQGHGFSQLQKSPKHDLLVSCITWQYSHHLVGFNELNSGLEYKGQENWLEVDGNALNFWKKTIETYKYHALGTKPKQMSWNIDQMNGADEQTIFAKKRKQYIMESHTHVHLSSCHATHVTANIIYFRSYEHIFSKHI